MTRLLLFQSYNAPASINAGAFSVQAFSCGA